MFKFLKHVFASAALLTVSVVTAAADEPCPTKPTQSTAAWCTYGMGGGIIQLAHTGNELWTPLPAEYKVCLADTIPADSKVTVFHETGASDSERTTLSSTEKCKCFRTTMLQLAYDSPDPQHHVIGGTYQAFRIGHCEKSAVPIKMGISREVIAPCKNVGTRAECAVPLPEVGFNDYRVCFSEGYIADRNVRLTLRTNSFEFGTYAPPRDYEPRNFDVTTSCTDIYRASSIDVVALESKPLNKFVKVQLQRIISFQGK